MTKSYWKWLGKAEFVPGVPARDLTDEEVDRRRIRELVELSPLFKKITPEKPANKENK